MSVGLRKLLLLTASVALSACTNVIPNVLSLSPKLSPTRITFPASGAYFNAIDATDVRVAGICTDDLELRFYVDGVLTTTGTCNAGTFSNISIYLPGADGSKLVEVVQSDNEGNTISSSVTYIKDTVVPALTFTAPISSYIATSLNGLSVAGECEAGLPVNLTGDITTPLTVICQNNGTFAATAMLTPGEGIKTINATSTDYANNQGMASVTFSYDEPDPIVSIAATASVNENVAGGIHTVTVTLSHAVSTQVTVEYSAGAGGSAGIDDYTVDAGTLTFAPGETSRAFAVTIINDGIYEGNEEAHVIITNVNGANAQLGNNRQVITIIDDESEPLVRFMNAVQTSVEGQGSANIAIELSHPSAMLVTVDVSLTGGTATLGDDFTFTNTTISFMPGQTSSSVTIVISDDLISELTEDFTLALSNPSGAILQMGASVHTHNLIDNDDIPTVEFALADSSESEGTDVYSLSVVLSNPSSQETRVSYAVTGGTATGGGVDYSLDSGTLTFPPLTTMQSITILHVDDALYEGNETVVVTLTGATGLMLGGQTVHTHTIVDDDGAPEVNFATANSSSDENVGTHNVTVLLSQPLAVPVTVDFEVDAASTAVGGGIDYSLSSFSISFAAGETTKNIAIDVIDDNIGEPIETIILNLVSVNGGGATLGSGNQHTYSISASDEPSVFFAAGASSSVAEETSSGVHLVSIELTNPSATDVYVDYVATPGPDMIVSDDYHLPGGTLTFMAGQTTQTLTIPIANDYVVEGNETFEITLTSAHPIIGPNPHIVTIIDSTPTTTVEFVLAALNVSEDGNYNLQVRLADPVDEEVSVVYYVSATSTAQVSDYSLTETGVLTFAPGVTIQNISITIVPDTVTESPDEFIDLILTDPQPAALVGLGGNSQMRVTIIDDDFGPPFTWTGLAGDNNWNTPGNWSTGVVPGVNDTATFGNACTGANCNVVISSNVSVGALMMGETYNGTITHNPGAIFNIGASGSSATVWTIAGGTYIGSTGAINVRGNLLQSGGTIQFGNQDIAIEGSVTRSAGNINFDPVSRLYLIGPSNAGVTVDFGVNDVQFGNLIVNKNGPVNFAGTGSIFITGDLSLQNPSSLLNGNTIRLRGNLLANFADGGTSTIEFDGTGNQSILGNIDGVLPNIVVNKTSGTITLASSIVIRGNLTLVNGDMNPGLSSVYFEGPSSAINCSSICDFNDLIFNNSVSTDLTGALNVFGDLLIGGDGSLNGPTSNIFFYGENLSAFAGSGGDATIRLVGVGGIQNIEAAGSGTLPSLVFDSSSAVNITSDIRISGNFIYSSTGSVNVGITKVVFVGDSNVYIDASAFPFWDVDFMRTGNNVLIYGSIDIDNNLVVQNCLACSINGGTIDLSGDLDYRQNGGGTTQLRLVGPTDQYIAYSGGVGLTGGIVVAKPSGIVRQDSSFSWATTPLSLDSNSTWDTSGHNLSVENLTIAFGSRIFKGCGNLNINGNLQSAGPYGDGYIYEGNYGVSIGIAEAGLVLEGQPLQFVVSLSQPNCTDTTFQYFTSDGTSTAIAGIDYQPIAPTTGSIAAGQTSFTILVNTLTDDQHEMTEYLTVSLSDVSVGDVSSVVAIGTILDINGVPEINVLNASTAEGGIAPFVVTLSHPTYLDVVFEYVTSDGTATANTDYVQLSGTFSIAAGSTSSIISVSTFNDSDYEGNEIFNLTLSKIVNAQVGNVVAIGTIEERGIQISNLDLVTTSYNSFSASVEFQGDVDNDATVTLHYCNDSENPGCNPLLMGTTATMLRSSSTYYAEVTALPTSYSGATLNVVVVANDADDGVSGSPLNGQVLMIDAVPRVLEINSPNANGTYTDGDAITINVTFNMDITLSGPDPSLILNTMPTRTAELLSIDSNTISFRYLVQPGDSALDLDATAISLNGGSIVAANSPFLPANITQIAAPLAFNKEIRINPRPIITGTTCMFEAYAGEPYLGCSFTAFHVQDIGDTAIDFSLVSTPNSCEWVLGISDGAPTANITVPGTLPTVTAESCEIVVRVSDGTHFSNDYRVPVKVHPQRGFQAVSQSGFHGCAVADGYAKCWGSQHSQANALGDDVAPGNYADYVLVRPGPNMDALSNVTDIKAAVTSSANNAFSCLRLQNGSIRCWGNGSGLKNGEPSGNASVFALPLLDAETMGPIANVATFDIDGNGGCALVYDSNPDVTGKVKCWGSAGGNRLGDGSMDNRYMAGPVMFSSLEPLKGAVQLSVSANFACAVLGDGSVRCWGSNAAGQLGHGNTNTVLFASAPVLGFGPERRAVKVAVGANHACALDIEGKIRCWGNNSYGQLGRPTINFEVTDVLDFGNSDRAVDLELGLNTSCAIFENAITRYAKCWGQNTGGLLGIGNSDPNAFIGANDGDLLSLPSINFGSGLVPFAISIGRGAACAIVGAFKGATTGVKCWGTGGSTLHLGDPNSTDNKGLSISDMGDNLPYVPLYARLYVSSGLVAANMVKSVTGAQQMCVDDAAINNLPSAGHARVFVATSTRNLYDIATSSQRIMNGNLSNIIANSSADLFSLNLQSKITTITGSELLESEEVWTGSSQFGDYREFNSCNDWTTTTESAVVGRPYYTDVSWIMFDESQCNTSKRVYCYIP